MPPGADTQHLGRCAVRELRTVENMSMTLALRVRDGSQPDPEPAGPEPAVHSSAGNAYAAVLPAPLYALGAAAVGSLLGFGAVYLVASRLAGTLAAVAAVVLIFAVTMAGPWVHARAGTEVGRVIAVALQAVAFGGAIGGLAIMT